MSDKRLREGFTTGSAATAASVAALSLLLRGLAPEIADIPVPPGARQDKRLGIRVAEARKLAEDTALAAVVKDGGDDPDATHNARIEALVRCSRRVDQGLSVHIEGGRGVGRVTLPGLAVPQGEAAINPGPREQIRRAVAEICAACGFQGRIEVTISVPEGARIARHTLNARLGIEGGISILGTQGTVRPYSHEAWQQTILQGLEVARATGCERIGLTSGRRSERLLMARLDWPDQAFIQAADFIGFAVRQAHLRGFGQIAWGGFFGKLLKIAQGHGFTHARATQADLPALAALCRRHGCADSLARAVSGANTAAQALEILLDDRAAHDVLLELALGARSVLLGCAGPTPPEVAVYLFHLDGTELVRV